MAAHAVDAQAIGGGAQSPSGLTPPPALPAIEGYEVRQQIGETPAGDVYLAAHTATGVLRTIAVQRAEQDPAATRRIVREVLEASRVKHPGVALVDGVGTTRDGRLYVATAYVPGTTLAEILVDDGHLPGRRAVHIALRAAEALEAAHRQGVVHGDLTPEHIIVGPAGPDGVEPVAVTGFGMTTARTGSASLVEPPKQARPYASPERVSGGYLDVRSDVFSLASIMLHALSGNAPPPPRAGTGRGNTPTSSMAIQPGARLAPAQVLLAARASEPDRRYPSAAVFRDTLAAAFGDQARRTPDAANAISTVAGRPTPAPAAAPMPTPAPTPTVRPAPVAAAPAPSAPTVPEPRPVAPLAAWPAAPAVAAAAALGVPDADLPGVAAPTEDGAPTVAAAPAVRVAPPVEVPRPARWELPDPELQAPSGLVTDHAVMMDAVPPLPFSAPPSDHDLATVDLSPPTYAPAAYAPSADAPSADLPFIYSPPPAGALDADAVRPSAAASLDEVRGAFMAPVADLPARRRSTMMIGGAAAAALLLGAWAMSGRAPQAGGDPAAASAVTAAGPAVATPVATLAAAPSPRSAGTPAAAPTGRTVAGAATAAAKADSAERAAEPAEIAPMPKVVVPDVALRGDPTPGATGLAQSALSEASSGPAVSVEAPRDGLTVDAATRSQINAAMGRFARALESRDMGTLQQAYPGISVAERNTWSSFFRSAESIRARFTAQEFQVMPDGVDVTAVGKLTFNKRDSRQRTENAVTFRVLLSPGRGGVYEMKKIH